MVLLSFDIEEFDLPIEQGYTDFPLEKQLDFSREGTEKILNILKKKGVRATFFSTVTFFESLQDDFRRKMWLAGHELASHGVHHSDFSIKDLVDSRIRLNSLWRGAEVAGFRMPRMMPISERNLADAGYKYNSSLNPTLIPGRYNHLTAPRLPYKDAYEIYHLPSSVMPICRFPLFWLSLHHLPLSLYLQMARYTARHDNYLSLYFHPWEFVDIAHIPKCKLSYTVRHNSGEKMCHRLETLIDFLLAHGYEFKTFSEYIENQFK